MTAWSSLQFSSLIAVDQNFTGAAKRNVDLDQWFDPLPGLVHQDAPVPVDPPPDCYGALLAVPARIRGHKDERRCTGFPQVIFPIASAKVLSPFLSHPHAAGSSSKAFRPGGAHAAR